MTGRPARAPGSGSTPAESFLGVREAARRLGVHENTVRNWVHEGSLTDARVPGSRYLRLRASEIDLLVAQRAANLARNNDAPEPTIVKIREIAADGLPDMENLTGRVAFIFDGCIVSGWPLHTDPEDYTTPYSGRWEADTDVGHNRPFAGVTHWVEFPRPIWEIAR